MKRLNKEHSVPRDMIVKHSNTKRVVIAVLLALAGLVLYTLSYQYTHQAKLEADLKAKQSQVQSQLQQLNKTKSLNAEQQKKIDDLNKQNQDLQNQLQAKAASKQRALAEAAPVGVKNCTDNVYKAFIYSHESGCNTASINRNSGACGLGQALPCSKLPCSLYDWACQDAFFTSYAIGRYGSWQNAYAFWVNHHWW